MSTWSGYKRVGDPLWATGLKGQMITWPYVPRLVVVMGTRYTV